MEDQPHPSHPSVSSAGRVFHVAVLIFFEELSGFENSTEHLASSPHLRTYASLIWMGSDQLFLMGFVGSGVSTRALKELWRNFGAPEKKSETEFPVSPQQLMSLGVSM